MWEDLGQSTDVLLGETIRRTLGLRVCHDPRIIPVREKKKVAKRDREQAEGQPNQHTVDA